MNSYDKYWRPLEADHWQDNIRQGRLLRPRLDSFFGHFLTVHLQREVQAHQLFTSLRDHIGRDAERAEQVLTEIARYANVFDSIELRTDMSSTEAATLRPIEIADTRRSSPYSCDYSPTREDLAVSMP